MMWKVIKLVYALLTAFSVPILFLLLSLMVYFTPLDAAVSEETHYISKGVDLSKWNKNVDYKKLSKYADFVMIRGGYGSDKNSQDDEMFKNHVKGCIENGISYGIYLYSYAMTKEQASAEADHIIRLLSECTGYGQNPILPVYLDIEDEKQLALSADDLGEIAETFCQRIESEGYKTGIYSSEKNFEDILTAPYFSETSKWIAQYGESCSYSGRYDIWQNSNEASVPGVEGKTDTDYMIHDVFCQKDLSGCSNRSGRYITYPGSLSAGSVSVFDQESPLVPYHDFHITAARSLTEGKETFAIYGKKDYTGKMKVSFDMIPFSLSPFSILYKKTVLYSGDDSKPNFWVRFGSKTLKEGIDYTVTYPIRSVPGENTAVIRGKGVYHCCYILSYQIVIPKSQVRNLTINGSTLTAEWDTVSYADGYEIAYCSDRSGKWYMTSTKENSYTFTSMLPAEYKVKIRPYVIRDGKKYYGEWSDQASAVIKM